MFGVFQRFWTPAVIKNSYICGDVIKAHYSKKLSQREKTALYKSLCLINENPSCYAKSFFKDLFKKYPEYAKFFKKYGNCPQDILENSDFIKKHAVGNVFGAISNFIKKLEDSCAAEAMMKKIGKDHQKYCMKPDQFKNARKVLLKSLEFNLGEKWDAEVEEGWKKATTIMFRGLQNGVKTEEDEC